MFQNQSPKFYPVPAPAFDRSDDKQRSSPSPPLQPRRLDGKSPSLVSAPSPPAVGRVERRVSLPAELLRSEDWVAAMAPVPTEKPSAPVTGAFGGNSAVQSPKLPVYPPPLVVAPMMVAPPPPKTTQGVTTVVDNKVPPELGPRMGYVSYLCYVEGLRCRQQHLWMDDGSTGATHPVGLFYLQYLFANITPFLLSFMLVLIYLHLCTMDHALFLFG